MALQQLSDAERKAALKKAAEARKKRAQLRKEIKAGRKNLTQVLAQSHDPIVARMKVSTLLQSLPGVGKVRAQKIMTDLRISTTRRVQGLGSKQRERLINEISR